MPSICLFYGILISMFYDDNERHHTPHIHASHGDFRASISIETGEVLAGSLSARDLKLVQAWIELRREDLYADWALALQHQPLLGIKPLE